jgi:hypothetical protein
VARPYKHFLLDGLIAQARQRRARLVDALADEDDTDMRAIYKEKIVTETANIRTWENEGAAVEHEAQTRLADTVEVRGWLEAFLARALSFATFTVAQRRKLALTLRLRVAVSRSTHQPWFTMTGWLPDLEAPWHAVPLRVARTNPDWLGLALDVDEQWKEEMAALGMPLLPAAQRSATAISWCRCWTCHHQRRSRCRGRMGVAVTLCVVRGWQAMELGDVLWVVAVIGFWALVFVLMFSFVWLISRGHDDEETVCELPELSSTVATNTQARTQL